MMNCHRVTRLISESRERPLGLREKIALRFHQAMCAGCRRFEGQVNFLGRASQRYSGNGDSSSPSGQRDSGNETENDNRL